MSIDKKPNSEANDEKVVDFLSKKREFSQSPDTQDLEQQRSELKEEIENNFASLDKRLTEQYESMASILKARGHQPNAPMQDIAPWKAHMLSMAEKAGSPDEIRLVARTHLDSIENIRQDLDKQEAELVRAQLLNRSRGI